MLKGGFMVLNSQADGMDCMIFCYYPRIHFNVDFWNQNSRKKYLDTKKNIHFLRAIFIQQQILNLRRSALRAIKDDWAVRLLGCRAM